jgi:hypothetical protein
MISFAREKAFFFLSLRGTRDSSSLRIESGNTYGLRSEGK